MALSPGVGADVRLQEREQMVMRFQWDFRKIYRQRAVTKKWNGIMSNIFDLHLSKDTFRPASKWLGFSGLSREHWRAHVSGRHMSWRCLRLQELHSALGEGREGWPAYRQPSGVLPVTHGPWWFSWERSWVLCLSAWTTVRVPPFLRSWAGGRWDSKMVTWTRGCFLPSWASSF